jgi:integrase
MPTACPLDSLGRRRSPAAVPGYLAGRPPRNKGLRYPPDPPRTEEIIAVMRCSGEDLHGARARGLIVVLWRAGLRIREALELTELDLDPRRGSILVRRGCWPRRLRSSVLSYLRLTRARRRNSYREPGAGLMLPSLRLTLPARRLPLSGSSGGGRRGGCWWRSRIPGAASDDGSS